MKRAQRNLELFKHHVPRNFGGNLLKGNAKCERPLSTKQAVHLILKSTIATGARSLLHTRHVKVIDGIIRKQAKRFGIRLYHYVNVANHLHLVLKLPQLTLRAARQRFFSFLRAVTGLIARQVLGAEKGSPKKLKFWQARPFTRLVQWGRDYKRLADYMEKNLEQACERAFDLNNLFFDPADLVGFDTG